MAARRWLALTESPSTRLEAGQRTYVEYQRPDLSLARQQHRQYCRLLSECQVNVSVSRANADCPDGVFVEDTAVVFPEGAVLCRPGAASRRQETLAMVERLQPFRPLLRVHAPATLDGGDVLRVGCTVFVGKSSRTNARGIQRLQQLIGRWGYRVVPVPVAGSLHLKTACTVLPDGCLVVNSRWIDMTPLQGRELWEVPQDEPWAANLLPIEPYVVLSTDQPRTSEFIAARGFRPRQVNLSEFAKLEGGVTCLSVMLDLPLI